LGAARQCQEFIADVASGYLKTRRHKVNPMFVDPDFVPFQPPPRPLGLRGLPTLWRNYIETIPQPAYEQGITHVRTHYSDVLWSASLK
jgi:hypothetical protein